MTSGYKQIPVRDNEASRVAWVEEQLQKVASQHRGSLILDVGAGLSPFKALAIKLGLLYESHDFGDYKPSEKSPGLQNDSWHYEKHKYNCDILEIPESAHPSIILCTEVLEHVPDPVRAFKHMVRLLEPGGHLIVSVPFLSLMHQSPFWFQSGLSPFWFEYWAKEYDLEIEELTIQGDYLDLMSQEFFRTVTVFRGAHRITRPLSKLVQRLRPWTPQAVLQSGAFSTLFVARKP